MKCILWLIYDFYQLPQKSASLLFSASLSALLTLLPPKLDRILLIDVPNCITNNAGICTTNHPSPDSFYST